MTRPSPFTRAHVLNGGFYLQPPRLDIAEALPATRTPLSPLIVAIAVAALLSIASWGAC